jgi:hypothetical protein
MHPSQPQRHAIIMTFTNFTNIIFHNMVEKTVKYKLKELTATGSPKEFQHLTHEAY